MRQELRDSSLSFDAIVTLLKPCRLRATILSVATSPSTRAYLGPRLLGTKPTRPFSSKHFSARCTVILLQSNARASPSGEAIPNQHDLCVRLGDNVPHAPMQQRDPAHHQRSQVTLMVKLSAIVDADNGRWVLVNGKRQRACIPTQWPALKPISAPPLISAQAPGVTPIGNHRLAEAKSGFLPSIARFLPSVSAAFPGSRWSWFSTRGMSCSATPRGSMVPKDEPGGVQFQSYPGAGRVTDPPKGRT